ncbi:MAG TPA: spore coat protein [Thermaerobacter sp.]
MSHITQHMAAELWEVCRDHAVAATKLRALAPSCHDPQLRSTLERHAGDFQQAAQRLMQFLQQPGAHGQAGSWQAGWQGSWQAHIPVTGQAGQGASWQAHGNPGAGHTAYGQAGGQQALDVVMAADCLRQCKTFAVQCIWAASECAEPARSYLYQLAGEHLRMAQEHYRWLDQRGIYAHPKADQAAISEYAGKLGQVMQVGQAAAATGFHPATAGAGSYARPASGGYAYQSGSAHGYGSHAYAYGTMTADTHASQTLSHAQQGSTLSNQASAHGRQSGHHRR